MKKILSALLVLGLLGGAYGYYLWNKPPESMAKKTADLGIPAATLFAEFKAGEEAANAKYVGKIVAVSGTVLESKNVDGTTKVSLNAGADGASVLCEFDPQTQHARTAFAVGESVTLKGECSGADLDGTVMLSRCAEMK
jgi:hypothetical protein